MPKHLPTASQRQAALPKAATAQAATRQTAPPQAAATTAPVRIGEALANPQADKRLQVLALIGHCGSISEAARRAGVSYKAAWQAVDTLNNLAGSALVEKAVGGSGGGGARLTPAGVELLRAAELLARTQERALAQWARHPQTGTPAPAQVLPRLALRTSMRNQLPCTIGAVKRVGAMVEVSLQVAPGIALASRITRESVQLLGLTGGLPVLAMFKATAVQVIGASVTDTPTDSSAAPPNRLAGTVTRVGRGTRIGDATEVAVALPNGTSVVGFAAADAGLRKGQRAVCRVEASSVVIALGA